MLRKIISEDTIELIDNSLFFKKTIGILQYKSIDSYLQIENFRVSSRMDQWLPAHIGRRLQQGFRDFDRKYRGFLTNEAVILAI